MRYLTITIHDNDFWNELKMVADLLVRYHSDEIKKGFEITEFFKSYICEAMNLFCNCRNTIRDIFDKNNNNANKRDYYEYFINHIEIKWIDKTEWDNAESVVIDRHTFKITIV